MKSPKDKARYRRWRIENPDKVKAQRDRHSARKRGELAPWVKPAPLTAEEINARAIERKKRDYQRRKARMAADPEYAASQRAKEAARGARRYAKLVADPAALEAKREKERIRKRLKFGIPLDAPVIPFRLTDEDRARRKAEKERIKAERAAARKPPPPKLTEEERRQRRRAKQREYDKRKRDIVRAKRAAEIAVAMAAKPPPPPPNVCPDPPELQALFKKASKGEPPTPHNPYVKKRSAFQIRGWI